MEERAESQAQLTRRKFVVSTGALAAFAIVPRHVLGAAGQPAPSEKMNIGCVGVGGMQGGSDVRSVSGENIYALCDVDDSQMERTAAQYPSAKRYRDFREMLDKEHENLHGITITIPDHMHASVALWAMERGIAGRDPHRLRSHLARRARRHHRGAFHEQRRFCPRHHRMAAG